MSKSVGEEVFEPANSTAVELEIWHPNCWTLNVTERADAGLIGNGVYKIGPEVRARLTAYADTVQALDHLEKEIEASPLTNSVQEVDQFLQTERSHAAAGNATRELLVRYPAHNSIHTEMVSRGFVPDAPVRVRDGKEYWTVICTLSREEIQRRLDRVRSSMGAEIDVLAMKSPSGGSEPESEMGRLSERQREAFELARREGYYSWPREVSVADLAAEVPISKATLLEHLRKAEAKLLGPKP